MIKETEGRPRALKLLSSLFWQHRFLIGQGVNHSAALLRLATADHLNTDASPSVNGDAVCSHFSFAPDAAHPHVVLPAHQQEMMSVAQ